MEALFLTLVNLSIQTGWLISTVAILRLLLKKTPKWIICLLWGLVGIRLIFPFSLESGFSLIPSAQTIPPDISFHKQPEIHSGLSFIKRVGKPCIIREFCTSDRRQRKSSASLNMDSFFALDCRRMHPDLLCFDSLCNFKIPFENGDSFSG